jgi:MOSC domain-containing protein YiiM
MSDREGTVVAVCLKPSGGVPKEPQEAVTVGAYGVEGDFHAGEQDKRGDPNRRQVTVVGKEAIDAVNELLNVQIPPGGLGENVLVSGLGDLGDVRPGQRLRFSSGVELQVTEQNNPCKNLQVYHLQAPKHLYGRRGLLTVVVSTGRIAPGDSVYLLDG